MKRNCRFVCSGNLKRRDGLGAQWIISLSLTPELILVLVTETHLQDRTNCLSSQHAFLQAGPHFYTASSHYQMMSGEISAKQNYSSRGPNTSYSSQRQDMCVCLTPSLTRTLRRHVTWFYGFGEGIINPHLNYESQYQTTTECFPWKDVLEVESLPSSVLLIPAPPFFPGTLLKVGQACRLELT